MYLVVERLQTSDDSNIDDMAQQTLVADALRFMVGDIGIKECLGGLEDGFYNLIVESVFIDVGTHH